MRYATEEAWQNAQAAKRRYSQEYWDKNREEIYARRKVRLKHARGIRRRRLERVKERFAEVFDDFGPVIVKLSYDLELSQDRIYELLGGLVSRNDICAILKQEQEKRRKLRSRNTNSK